MRVQLASVGNAFDELLAGAIHEPAGNDLLCVVCDLLRTAKAKSLGKESAAPAAACTRPPGVQNGCGSLWVQNLQACVPPGECVCSQGRHRAVGSVAARGGVSGSVHAAVSTRQEDLGLGGGVEVHMQVPLVRQGGAGRAA